jgi:hypothetical protein
MINKYKKYNDFESIDWLRINENFKSIDWLNIDNEFKSVLDGSIKNI